MAWAKGLWTLSYMYKYNIVMYEANIARYLYPILYDMSSDVFPSPNISSTLLTFPRLYLRLM